MTKPSCFLGRNWIAACRIIKSGQARREIHVLQKKTRRSFYAVKIYGRAARFGGKSRGGA